MSTAAPPPMTGTWRLLGLSVAATYVGLGSIATFAPGATTRLFLGDAAAARDAQQDARAARLLPALGARDLSIGLALGAFHYFDLPRPMAILILSSFVLCAVDVEMVARHRGLRDALPLGVGAAGWMWIGWELLRRS